METALTVLSPQEKRVAVGKSAGLTTEDAKLKRIRVEKILRQFNHDKPRLSVERARWFTESFRQTEHLPLVLRWAKAMQNIAQKIQIYIGPHELIVGRCGPPGRYGILYPELESAYFAKMDEILMEEQDRPYVFEKEDIEVIKEELVPYWYGKTFLETVFDVLPEETRQLTFKNNDMYSSSFIIHQTATVRHSIQWCLDYEKILTRGFKGIKDEAEAKLKSLDIMNADHNFNKMPFYQAVIIVCDAMITFAERHAEKARAMAALEKDGQRRKELLEIAEICEWVPEKPARTFREAVQSQWFTQVGSRFEQIHGGIIGNGRIDQYLYPYYKKDRNAGRITDDDVLELLECLWLNMAQCIRMHPTPGGFKIYEGNAHFENTNIGGQRCDGQDATNELSYLVLQSKKEFPLDFPDLSVRIHSRTPDAFLHKVCELIKEGTGFPKLMNDEEIIPILLAKGAAIEEARDYIASGCTEVRLVNRNTYFTGTTWLNLGAVLEMALYNGKVNALNGKKVGLSTGDPRKFTSFQDMWQAFKTQLEYTQKHVFIQQYLTDVARPQKLAFPLLSSLHDLCMDEGKDISEGKFKNGISLGGQTGVVGFGTVIDSLAAIKKLVFEDRSVSMNDLLKALQENFEGHEVIRQLCLNAPKYGNCIAEVDAIGRDIEGTLLNLFDNHINAYGGRPELFYVPVTTHVPMGKRVGATPNGRKEGEALSEGISPSQGCDVKGPTATLASIDATKRTAYTQRAARLLNIKLTPQTVLGDEGTKRLAALIRTWCDQKHWHLQFNIINRETLVEAKTNPEKYRNLLVRVAGYSAYFVDLSPALQDEIIARTEHRTV